MNFLNPKMHEIKRKTIPIDKAEGRRNNPTRNEIYPKFSSLFFEFLNRILKVLD